MRSAIKGAAEVGSAACSRLHADGISVVDVPATLARRVRLLPTGHGHKSDPANALAVRIQRQPKALSQRSTAG